MLRSSGSGQLTFEFTDSFETDRTPEKKLDFEKVSTGGECEATTASNEADRYASELVGREYLQFRSKFKETDEPDAEASALEPMLLRIARTPNLASALLKVASNKGASGIDGVSIQEVVDQAHKVLPRLKDAILKGTYQPGDIRRVWIPKPGGGHRGLGIPNVIDRVVAQACLQILEPLFDTGFHDSSHGYRRKRGAQTLVAQAKKYLSEGYTVTVDIDLSKFFDRVNHQRLLSRLAQKIPDGRVLQLIHRMLKAKVVLPDGTRVDNDEGTPQGGPLSPLLSNVVLDELDWELDRRGLRFVRYADDFSIFVRSERSGHRVMASVTRYIEKRLRLVVNVDKSRVSTSSDGVSLLSFHLKRKDDGEIRIGISKRAQKKVDKKVRELTPRNLGGTFDGCLKRIRTYLNGWFGYFRLATTGTVFKELDAHIRRRLRQILACRFKRPRYLYRHLLRLGIKAKSAAKACYEIRSPWARSISPALNKAYHNAWFAARLTPLYDRWLEIHPPKDSVIKQLLLFE
jgi:group II intron reverse transcriptase/maturase